jgi:hypothetical protein
VFSLFEESTRKPIPMKVKRQVYKRAKGKSEQCGKVIAEPKELKTRLKRKGKR